MSLLPIIYTSLLIFSSVLLVVLVVSYISYKYKQSDQVALVGIDNSNGYRNSNHSNNTKYQRSANGKSRNVQSNNVISRHNEQIRNFPMTKSNYYRDQRNIGDRRIDVIYREKSPTKSTQPSQIRRMSVVEDISKNSMPEIMNHQYNINNSLEFSRNSGGNILRYYEDF